MYVIVGNGYVGSALAAAAGPRLPHLIIDPKYPHCVTWDEIALRHEAAILKENVAGVIVCVSTPSTLDGGCDVSNVRDVLGRVAQLTPSIPVLIKSTVSLEGWDSLRERFPQLSLTYSPEFLKADTAADDFANQDFVIVGGDDADFWGSYFTAILSSVDIHICTAKEAILIKYASNCFLSVKVSFFNQIYDLCRLQGLDFETVRTLLTLRSDIGENHTRVTSQRGWGGACFPKDTSAMLQTCARLDYDFTTLHAAVKYNWSIREGIMDVKDAPAEFSL